MVAYDVQPVNHDFRIYIYYYHSVMLRAISAAILLLAPSLASADCYSWPLRTDTPAYDGDTIKITMPGLPPALADMSVRIAGVDAAEIKGKCKAEQVKAIEARNFVAGKLADARSIRFCNPKWGKYAGRVLADVFLDGQSLAAMLLEAGLARSYDGGKRGGWCE